MTVEELLKPRYKVIADYPCSMHNIGDVFTTYDNAMLYAVQIDDVSEKVCLADYPHLFKKLEWWEEREEKDMPEYIKWPDGTIEHVSFDDEGLATDAYTNKFSLVSAILPATKEEYENQNK